MTEPSRRDFLAVATLGSAGLGAGCASRLRSLEGNTMMRKVSFKRDGLTLAGNLFVPESCTNVLSARRKLRGVVRRARRRSSDSSGAESR